jgi:hypothetical protein
LVTVAASVFSSRSISCSSFRQIQAMYQLSLQSIGKRAMDLCPFLQMLSLSCKNVNMML